MLQNFPSCTEIIQKFSLTYGQKKKKTPSVLKIGIVRKGFGKLDPQLEGKKKVFFQN